MLKKKLNPKESIKSGTENRWDKWGISKNGKLNPTILIIPLK